jgi:hypothetical protein
MYYNIEKDSPSEGKYIFSISTFFNKGIQTYLLCVFSWNENIGL